MIHTINTKSGFHDFRVRLFLEEIKKGGLKEFNFLRKIRGAKTFYQLKNGDFLSTKKWGEDFFQKKKR